MLVSSNLKTELEKIFDQESSLFTEFPESKQEAAEKWGSAFDSYAKQVIPSSISSEAAKSAFITSFLAINESNGSTQFPLCFFNYATALSTGMSPAFAGVPPVSPPILAPVFAIGLSGGKSSQCITSLVSILDTWMRTGTAINSVSGVVIPWS